MSVRWLRYMVGVFYPLLMFVCFPLWYLLSLVMTLPEELTLAGLAQVEMITAFMLIVMLVYLWWVTRKRANVEQQVREAARGDARGFFLILRSFHQTEPYETSGGSLDMEGRLPAPAKSLLPLLGHALLGIGVPVLLGEPKLDDTGEIWPGIIVRTTDQNWRAAFDLLAHACRALILIPADTPGSLEEMVTVQGSNLWHKTIVFVPPPVYYHGLSRYETTDYEQKGWFGAFTEFDEKVTLEKKNAWSDLRDRLAVRGIQLPPFEEDGCIYLPKSDFSIQHKVALTDSGEHAEGKDEALTDQLRLAFETLLAAEELPGMPVRDMLGALEEVENLPEVGE